jgi:hypothetical protein
MNDFSPPAARILSIEEEKLIQEEQAILRSGEASSASLCQYKNVSCIRCCLPHIGGDSHMEDSAEKRLSLFNKDRQAYHLRYANRYLGPGNMVMKFKNFNPMKDPKIEASQYEDSFPDVGKDEMERRFSGRRSLFLNIYDPKQPRQSLPQYMKAAQNHEGYTYTHEANTGLASMYIGGSFSAKCAQKGELPECQLLGFVDEQRRAGCMAHPFAESSQGYDGRNQVGFFHHSGCCDSVGCEASKEFPYLSSSARQVFDKAIDGMSWYEFSRHATSVLVYYLRSYDFIVQRLDESRLLSSLTLKQIVEFTNILYDEWPFKNLALSVQPPPSAIQDPEVPMNSLQILSFDIPLPERILYIALNTRFVQECFALQLQQARNYINKCIKAYCGQ